MSLVVQKVGGTSVADADRMKAVAEHVAFTRRQDSAPQRPPEQRSLSREELRELVAEMLG